MSRRFTGRSLANCSTKRRSDLIVCALAQVGKDHSGAVRVKVDPRYFRPTEVDVLLGNPDKARTQLKWNPSKVPSLSPSPPSPLARPLSSWQRLPSCRYHAVLPLMLHGWQTPFPSLVKEMVDADIACHHKTPSGRDHQ